ncbi:MAG: sulfotransferase family 2 domain-containing protein, partial [Planctomycetaceae bacterium]|nr:sulfotransferase family 2 domain-containing protein [Planctomycetaceae bacterium]
MSSPAEIDWPLMLAWRLALHDARLVRPPNWRQRLVQWWTGQARDVNVATAPYVKKQNVFFLHIPKSGGTSFDAFVSTFFSLQKVLPVDLQYLGWKWNRGEPSPFRYIHLATEYDSYRDRRNELHFITLLRNPVSRILSDYWYHREKDDYGREIARVAAEHQPRWDKARGLSLEEWSQIPVGAAGAYPRNLNLALLTCGTRKLAACSPKQLSRLLKRAQRTLRDEFSFFGIMEEYTRSKQLFCQTFGLPPHFANGQERRNMAASTTERSPPDEATLKRIREENAWDVELYEYARELFTARCRAFDATSWDDLTAIRISPDDDRYPREAGMVRIDARRMRGSGLYREEVNPSGWSHRWTGSLPVTTLNFGAKLPIGAEVTVRLELAAVVNAEAWNSMRITFDGAEAQAVERSHGPGRLFYTCRFLA